MNSTTTIDNSTTFICQSEDDRQCQLIYLLFNLPQSPKDAQSSSLYLMSPGINSEELIPPRLCSMEGRYDKYRPSRLGIDSGAPLKVFKYGLSFGCRSLSGVPNLQEVEVQYLSYLCDCPEYICNISLNKSNIRKSPGFGIKKCTVRGGKGSKDCICITFL